MTAPKTISDFAREYEELYVELTQYRSAYPILFKERDEWKAKAERLEKELNELKK